MFLFVLHFFSFFPLCPNPRLVLGSERRSYYSPPPLFSAAKLVSSLGGGRRGGREGADTTEYFSNVRVSDSLSNAVTVDVCTCQDSEKTVCERLKGTDKRRMSRGSARTINL